MLVPWPWTSSFQSRVERNVCHHGVLWEQAELTTTCVLLWSYCHYVVIFSGLRNTFCMKLILPGVSLINQLSFIQCFHFFLFSWFFIFGCCYLLTLVIKKLLNFVCMPDICLSTLHTVQIIFSGFIFFSSWSTLLEISLLSLYWCNFLDLWFSEDIFRPHSGKFILQITPFSVERYFYSVLKNCNSSVLRALCCYLKSLFSGHLLFFCKWQILPFWLLLRRCLL